MAITKSSAKLVQEASAQITSYSVAQVRARLDDAGSICFRCQK